MSFNFLDNIYHNNDSRYGYCSGENTENVIFENIILTFMVCNFYNKNLEVIKL